jgi:hypothetical protein
MAPDFRTGHRGVRTGRRTPLVYAVTLRHACQATTARFPAVYHTSVSRDLHVSVFWVLFNVTSLFNRSMRSMRSMRGGFISRSRGPLQNR